MGDYILAAVVGVALSPLVLLVIATVNGFQSRAIANGGRRNRFELPDSVEAGQVIPIWDDIAGGE